jgi:hypothetical protein
MLLYGSHKYETSQPRFLFRLLLQKNSVVLIRPTTNGAQKGTVEQGDRLLIMTGLQVLATEL